MKRNLPAGFTLVDERDFARAHDFRAEPVLRGKVGEVRLVPQRNKRVKVMEVTKDDGEVVSVWESEMLGKLFARARKGDEIFVETEHEAGDNERNRISGYIIGIKPAAAKK